MTALSTDSTYAGLVRSVLWNPADDGPRMVLADWLRGEGETERAEFIQVQCELAAIELPRVLIGGKARKKRYEFLAIRSAALLARHEREWFADVWALLPKCGGCLGSGYFVPNFICASCHGTGTTAKLTCARGFPASIEIDGRSLWGGVCEMCQNIDRNRPFCRRCKGTGRIPGIGGKLFTLAPFVKVTVTDAEPYSPTVGTKFHWFNAAMYPVVGGHHPQSNIPTAIFNRLARNPNDTAPLAVAALSDAIVAEYREQAGLPQQVI